MFKTPGVEPGCVTAFAVALGNRFPIGPPSLRLLPEASLILEMSRACCRSRHPFPYELVTDCVRPKDKKLAGVG